MQERSTNSTKTVFSALLSRVLSARGPMESGRPSLLSLSFSLSRICHLGRARANRYLPRASCVLQHFPWEGRRAGVGQSPPRSRKKFRKVETTSAGVIFVRSC